MSNRRKRFDTQRRGSGRRLLGLESQLKQDLRKEVEQVLPDLAWEGYKDATEAPVRPKKKIRKQPEPWEFTEENPYGLRRTDEQHPTDELAADEDVVHVASAAVPAAAADEHVDVAVDVTEQVIAGSTDQAVLATQADE